MNEGTRLALLAIVLGLRRSGQLSDHALRVVTDELRLAAREAVDNLFDVDARYIEALAEDLAPSRFNSPTLRGEAGRVEAGRVEAGRQRS